MFLGHFRWKYVIPRACIVAAIYCAVRYGLDPALQMGIVGVGEAAIGAKVELGELTTSLRDGRIELKRFAAANPKKPLRNLFEADDLVLHVDAGQLLRKRVVVRDGFIRGLQFDSERATSGALLPPTDEDAGPSMLDPVIAAASDQAAAWFNDIAGRVEQDLLGSLATPRLAQELEDRWPKQYDALRARADDLRARGKQIEDTFREVKKNPLRNLAAIEELQQQLKAAETKLHNTLVEIRGLPAQAQADRAAIDAARKQDEQFLREHLKLGGVDGDQLTQYLLGEEASQYLSQTVYWANRVRTLIPKSKIAPPERSPGVNVLFVDRQLPTFLVQQVRLEGTARVDGQPLAFAGALTDATSEPTLHDRPLRLELTSSGAVGCHLVAQLDRRGELPHDSLTLDCPNLQLAHRTLGKADSFAVVVAPGGGSLHADLQLDGDQLTGVIHVRQASSLSATTPKLHDDRLAQVLAESLSGINCLEATVHLSGTLRRPECKIDSNLGAQLAAGVNGAVARYLTERKDRVMAKMQGKVDEQLARLESARRDAERELIAKLGEDQQLLGQLQALTGGKSSLPAIDVAKLGKSFSLDRLKR